MEREEYLNNPCRASSIPYWKVVKIAVPEHMWILHGEDFSGELPEGYSDEIYFRLKHDLKDLQPVQVPAGYALREASAEEFAEHICKCYQGIGVTAEELEGYTRREVYCPALWLALADENTGEIAATGIGELDRHMGEGILEWIQVSKEHRGRGLGSCIVRELLWRMKDHADFATVSGQCANPTNPEALYRKCGFTGNDRWHILRVRRKE